MVLELIDQMVRETLCGLMSEVLKGGDFDEEYVKKITGNEFTYFLGDSGTPCGCRDSVPIDESSKTIKACWGRIIKWIRDMEIDSQPLEPRGPRKMGEVHTWMYDRFSLKILLEYNGFADFSVKQFDDPEIPYWKNYNPDRSLVGHCERKPESLHVECQKPNSKRFSAAIALILDPRREQNT